MRFKPFAIQPPVLAGLLALSLVPAKAVDSAPPLLTMDELKQLAETAQPTGALAAKVKHLLATPFVNHSPQAIPKRPAVPGLGPILRIGAWNIERGNNFDLLRLSLSDPAAFARAVAEQNAAVEPKQRAKPQQIADAPQQSAHLAASDILILNESDLGMGRSDYRDVARELAHALSMSYAFGVEFIEVDRIYLGLERLEAPDQESISRFAQDTAVDESRYKGLHGSAILSRYPIRTARNIRLKPCYDWYTKERDAISELEKGKRVASKEVFRERIEREMRHGGRMALIVDLEVPESPTGLLTVVAAHLENKTRPSCRKDQLDDLLQQLRDVPNPLVLGGDLNTTGTDGAPTSIARELKKRVRNPGFWAGQAIRWFSPVAFTNVLAGSTNYFKNYQDPTAVSVPLIAVNREARLFADLEKFRFADGSAFDFSGTKMQSSNGRTGTLANSNDRAAKGFRPTFEFERDYGGLVGQLRLDWLLVKPVSHGGHKAFAFSPWFGTTLDHLNEAIPGQISDHHPITVDLPITIPTKSFSRSRPTTYRPTTSSSLCGSCSTEDREGHVDGPPLPPEVPSGKTKKCTSEPKAGPSPVYAIPANTPRMYANDRCMPGNGLSASISYSSITPPV
ncbi:MAG: hypothetical protein JNK87_14935 [Bryobacterales bacterium]|nr:hypothetical protein [Bryobacterales bacterium]